MKIAQIGCKKKYLYDGVKLVKSPALKTFIKIFNIKVCKIFKGQKKLNIF